ncbi:MAG: PEGA domain-containing protein [bacterium]
MPKRLLLTTLAILFTLTIALPAERDISVVGTDSKSAFKGKRYALVIGISRYQKLPPDQQLKYADRDARIFYDFLASPQGGGFVPEREIVLLTNEEATYPRVMQEIGKIVQRADKEDLVYIYFAGHGFVDENKEPWLLTYDSDPDNPYGVSISMEYLNTIVEGKIRSKHLVLVTDACHSGSIGAPGRRVGGENLINRYLTELGRAENSLLNISASKPQELSFEEEKWGGGHGVFTYNLVRGLRGEADRDRNGIVTATELQLYVMNKVSEETGFRQNPEFKGNYDSDLVLSVVSEVKAPPEKPAPKPAPEAPPVAKGSLSVESEPPGADVYLDGKIMGKTPIAIANLDAKGYNLVIRKSGYRDYVESVEVRGDSVTSIRATLSSAVRDTGAIYVSSNPSGAKVFLDGVERGVSPLAMKDIPVGRHAVEVRAEDYDAWWGEVDVKRNQVELVEAELKKASGSVMVISTPPKAKIFIDGKYVGDSPKTVEGVEVGEREITLAMEGYEDAVKKIAVIKDMTTALERTVGTLIVGSDPSGAYVKIDGVDSGRTPLTVKVPSGGHRVWIRAAKHREYSTDVDVGKDERREVFATLEKMPGRLTIDSTPDGASVYLDGEFKGKADLTIGEVKAGLHEIKVELGGYEVYEGKVALDAGESKAISVSLEKWKGPPGTEYTKEGRFYKRGKDGKEMVWIPGGTFQMGDGDPDEKPVHTVTLDGFWMDTTEVTNAEFKKFVDEARYSPQGGWKYDSGKANHPAVNVTWNDAVAYARWAGKRLPTEAEWEYAAGGPEHTKWSLGDEFDGSKYTWMDNQGNPTRPVASHPANGFGLYDMSGNVWEWCADWFSERYYANSPSANPKGPSSGTYRVLRGGSWYDFERSLRVACRLRYGPTRWIVNGGFRCAQSSQ